MTTQEKIQALIQAGWTVELSGMFPRIRQPETSKGVAWEMSIRVDDEHYLDPEFRTGQKGKDIQELVDTAYSELIKQ
jgi:hypothetical protein